MKFTVSEALASGQPALLDGAQWPPAAARRWTPDRLAELFPTLDPVRRGAPSGIFWNADAALADANRQHAAVGFAYAGRTHEESRVPTATFFDAADPQYFSGSLLDANGEPHPDLQPVTPLVEALSNGTAGATMTLKAWFGTAGAVTPLHYDTQHNVYAQLHGEKTFRLFSPSTLERSLYMYPRTHPLSHFSRVPDPTDADSAAQAEAFPAYAEGSFSAAASVVPLWTLEWQFTLRAGDALYIPPFWGHHATCERRCVAANVWVSSQAMHHHAAAVEASPLPFEGGWSPRRRVEAALLFLALMLRGLFGGSVERAAGAAARHLETRWRHAEQRLLQPQPAAGGRQEPEETAAAAAAAASASCDAPWLDAAARAKFERYAAARAAALGAIEPQGVRPTLIADQLDLLAQWGAATPAASHALLVRLSACCRVAVEGARARARAKVEL